MSKRTVGIVVMAAGVVLLAVALTADLLGFGGAAGFGWKQIAGTVVGALLVVSGAWWGWRSKKNY